MPEQDSLSLAGKVAIVTGSGKENGIGAGIVLALARAGARVVINYLSDTTAPRAEQTAAIVEAVAGKGNVLVVQADAASVEGAKKLADATLKGFDVDHIDILVNNAGAGASGPVLTTPPEVIKQQFDINAIGPIYAIQAVVPHMPRGGRIINIGTIGSRLGLATIPIYSAAKAAMTNLSFSMAAELGRERGITINTIAPGPVLTDMFHPNAPEAVHQFKNDLIAMTRAEGRAASVEDVADVALFLASEKSRWITGENISVSGGITGA